MKVVNPAALMPRCDGCGAERPTVYVPAGCYCLACLAARPALLRRAPTPEELAARFSGQA